MRSKSKSNETDDMKAFGFFMGWKPIIKPKKHRISEKNYLVPLLQLIDGDKSAFNRLVKAARSKRTLTEPIAFGFNHCLMCGDVPLLTDGLHVFPQKPCLYSKGIPLEFELKVPSGIMAVGNDLRPAFDVPDEHRMMTEMGTVQKSLAMAAIGCAHCYVGNSCPGVYQIGKQTFIIGCHQRGKRVASIVTDLWWYSIVDYDEYKRRGCTEDEYPITKVNVKPGVYIVTHYRHLVAHHDSDLFSKIKWLRKSD